MWDFIINPFITILALFYSVMGNNIVLAIALLTVVIRLLTSPLMIQQQRSAKAMQEIQPKMKELQEKYKNDREKLASAQMELYKEHGVNPLGGCLPLLVQFPILISLYGTIIIALGSTPFQLIDLSGRFILPGLDGLVPLQNQWIGMDLTLPPTANPAYALVLPILVMATSWLQSKLTIPTPAPSKDGKLDQTAQMTRTMTTIMPLMFGMFSLSFSVGLSIYFVVSNLVGIVQYSLMGKAEWRRLLGRAPAPTLETGAQPVAAAAGVVDGTAQAVSTEAGEKVKQSGESNVEKAPAKSSSAAKPKVASGDTNGSRSKSTSNRGSPRPKPRSKSSRKKARAK